MKLLQRLLTLTSIAAISAAFLTSDAFAQGSVWRNGNTWTATANGNTVYTGTRMFDAVNAACWNSGNGATIDIWDSGESGPDGGSVYAMEPLQGQTLDFHGNTVHCNGGDLVVPVSADRRHGITVRNLHVTGNPRYGLWFRGANDVTLDNITMDLAANPVGLGIRVDASTGAAGNLTISGNIEILGSSGHAVETYGIDGFSIGDVTAHNTGGSALILNDSRNGTVGNVVGTFNNQGGGYSTFRVANGNGPNVSVQSVYSRDSGRGFFSVSDSHGTTIDHVDIEDTTSHGIFLEDTWDTHILSGNVCNGSPNIQEVRTSNTTVNVTICGGGGGGGIADGSYRLENRANGLFLDNLGNNSNGDGVGQWSGSGHPNQWWEVSTYDGDWRRLQVSSTGHFLDGLGATADGADVGQWSGSSHLNQQWEIQHVEGEWHRLVNRNTGQALDTGGQNSNGDILQQWFVNSSHNQQWRFVQ